MLDQRKVDREFRAICRRERIRHTDWDRLVAVCIVAALMLAFLTLIVTTIILSLKEPS